MFVIKVGKMPIKISFWFVATLTLLLLIDKGGYGIVSIVTILLHELAHLFMFFVIGCFPKEISFEITGIKIIKPISKLGYLDEFLVQSAGIIANLWVFIMLLPWVLENGGQINTFNVFCFMNLAVGLFNALPIKMLDGGKLWFITLLKIVGVQKSTVICNWLSACATALVVAFSVWVMFFK